MDFDTPREHGELKFSESDLFLTLPFCFLFDETDRLPQVGKVRVCPARYREPWQLRWTEVSPSEARPTIFSDKILADGSREEITSSTFGLKRDAAGKNLLYFRCRFSASALRPWIEADRRRLIIDLGFEFDAGTSEVLFRLRLRKVGDSHLEIEKVHRRRRPVLLIANIALFLLPVGALFLWNRDANKDVHNAFLASEQNISLGIGFLLGFFGLQIAQVLVWVSTFRALRDFLRLPELFLSPSTFRAFRSRAVFLVSIALMSCALLITIFFESVSLARAKEDLPSSRPFILVDSEEQVVRSTRAYVRDVKRGFEVHCQNASGDRHVAHAVARAMLQTTTPTTHADDSWYDFGKMLSGRRVAQIKWGTAYINYSETGDVLRTVNLKKLFSRSDFLRTAFDPFAVEDLTLRELFCGGQKTNSAKAPLATEPRFTVYLRDSRYEEGGPAYDFLITYGTAVEPKTAEKIWRRFVERGRSHLRKNSDFEKRSEEISKNLLAQNFTEETGRLESSTILHLLERHLKPGDRRDERRQLLEASVLVRALSHRPELNAVSFDSDDYFKLREALDRLNVVKNMPLSDSRVFRAFMKFIAEIENRCGDEFVEAEDIYLRRLLSDSSQIPLDHPEFHNATFNIYFDLGMLRPGKPDKCADLDFRGFYIDRCRIMAKRRDFRSNLRDLIRISPDTDTQEFLETLSDCSENR